MSRAKNLIIRILAAITVSSAMSVCSLAQSDTEEATVSFSECTDWYRSEFPWFFSYLPGAANPKSDDLCRAFHEELMEIPKYRPIPVVSEIDSPAYDCRHYPTFLIQERYGDLDATELTLPHFLECTHKEKRDRQHLRVCVNSNLDLYANEFKKCLVEEIQKSDKHPSEPSAQSNAEALVYLWIHSLHFNEEYSLRWAQRMLMKDPRLDCSHINLSTRQSVSCRMSE